MIRVLLVDDDEERRTQLVDVVSRATAGVPTKIVEANAVVPAKVALSEEAFDILVVDLALPRRSGGDVVGDGGMQIITALEEDDLLRTPSNIIAITAHDNLHRELAAELATRSVGLLRYDRANDDWRVDLGGILARLVAAKTDQIQQTRSFDTDVAVVCALADPELTSLLRLSWQWRTVRYDYDSTIYHMGAARGRCGALRIVGAAALRKGMPTTAALAGKMIAEFHPRYLAMIGIAAGTPKHTRLGDVLVADPSWDAGSGKWTLENGQIVFQQAPNQLPLHNSVREAVRLLCRDTASLSTIRSEWPGAKPAHELRVILGPLASNAAVIADGVSLDAVARQHREVIGLEMEAYGVFAAGEVACEPRPIVFALKSVVDFGDPEKGDEVREYAAYTSAAVLRVLLERYL